MSASFVMRIRCALTPLLAILLLLTSPAHGQNAQGTIVGHVTDPSGAVVGGAKVTITDISNNVARRLTTNAGGDYAVPDQTASSPLTTPCRCS